MNGRLDSIAANFDTSPPTVIQVVPAPGNISSLSQITITFSEPVSGISRDDLLLNGIQASALSGAGTIYTFTFDAIPDGVIDVAWDGGHGIGDAAGNRFDELAPSSTWQYNLKDSVAPVVIQVTPAPRATIGRLTQIEITFSEPVSGVDAKDLLINDEPAGLVSGSGVGPYIFQLVQPTAGAVRVSWSPAHGIQDRATAPNLFAGGAWSYTLNPTAQADDVIINEFLAVNETGLKDEDNEAEDWIELFNRSDHAVNLSGWSLTDQADKPGEWEFPSVTLGPHEYLIVFASGKDRKPIDGGRLHTNFKLSASGEFLALFNAESPRQLASIFAPTYPEQRTDISYGVTSSSTLGHFSKPTPGGPNGALETFSGVAELPKATIKSGFFTQPFSVSLSSTTPGATIYYTLNGTVPTSSTGTLYSGPLSIAGAPGSAVITLSAAAFKDRFLPSRVASFTYLFPDHVTAQPASPAGFPSTWVTAGGTTIPGDYEMDPRIISKPSYTSLARQGLTSIPTLSVILKSTDLFSRNTGIYANPAGVGVAWEHPASAEFIFPDGKPSFQIDAGLRVQGGSSRDPNKTYKHSLRLLFKGDYGDSKLNYRLFPDSPVEDFDTIVLDAGLNLVWHHRLDATQRLKAQYVRDQFVSDLQIAMGWPAPHGKFFNLYLDGLYWGMYGVHERPDASFTAAYFGGNKEEYDNLKNTTGFEALTGDFTAWNAMMNLVNSGLAKNSQYEALQKMVNVTNLADYMLLNIWAGNTDWPQHNWYVSRKREPDGQFYFFSWDAEHVLKVLTDNRTTAADNNTPARIYDQLRRYNSEFRLLFADRVQRYFFNGGLFFVDPSNPEVDPAHPERNVPASIYLRRIAEIDPTIILESARWGDTVNNPQRPGQPYERNVEWINELNWLRNDYFPQRTAIVLNQLKSAGLYPTTAIAPNFSQQGGWAPRGFALRMSAPSGKIYYTLNGSDPRAYGSGGVAADALLYSGAVTLDKSVVVKARTLNGQEWSALNETAFSVDELGVPIRITEIMYRPIGGDPYEFVELQNVGDVLVDAGGFCFEGFSYIFPPATILSPGQVILLASGLSPASFAARYPNAKPAGFFSGNLSDGGERLALLDRSGKTITSVHFNNKKGWPSAADGGGRTLEVLDPLGNPDDPANWRASVSENGSPGMANPSRELPQIRLNEVFSANDLTATNNAARSDWLEIFNSGAAKVDLSGWSLTDDDNPRRFVFPPNSNLEAGKFLVVWCDSLNQEPGFHTGFALNRDGESVFLYDAGTNRIDGVTFGPQVSGFSLGRSSDPSVRWRLNIPTPGAPNLTAAMASSANLAINEWLASAAPGGSDWIELYNRSPDQPATLQNLYFSTGNALFQIKSLAFIPPQGHLRLFADEDSGATHLGFKLSAAGGTIALHDSDGAELDRINYTQQSEGISEGRIPDGGAKIVKFATPTPGATNSSDTDGDGLPDEWEVAHGLNPNDPSDAAIDSDGDGFTNLQEYVSGTDPRDRASYLRLDFAPTLPGNFTLRFVAMAGKTYTVQVRENLASGVWQKLSDVAATASNRTIEILEPNQNATTTRFYRLLTPKAP